MTHPKQNWIIETTLKQPCGQPRSKRSTARCELPLGHNGGHFGRTQCGYWKHWDEPMTHDYGKS